MRLNLNFKDADIQKVDDSTFKITFDMSTLNKPRLSQDARLYIEHFHLPEFVDDKNGRNKGEMYGYFELRCDNITGSGDWDSEKGQTGSVILFTSPLNNYASFTNNDPMYIRNFKINQNFFTNKLTFMLRIYDRFGDPFIKSETADTEIDENNTEYATYQQQILQLNQLNADKLDIKNKLIEAEKEVKAKILATDFVSVILRESRTDLLEKIDDTIAKSKSVKDKLRAELFKDIIQMGVERNIIYLFEVFLKTSGQTNAPYNSFKAEYETYYNNFIQYLFTEYELEQARITRDNIVGNDPEVWLKFKNTFLPDTHLIKPDALTNVPYEVRSTAAPTKTGHLDVKFFNSLTHTKSFVIVSNITPDLGDDNILEKGDVLEIDDSYYDNILPTEFNYDFFKNSTNAVEGSVTSLSGGISTSSRFSLRVTRKDNSYSFDFTNDIPAVGFKVGGVITIKGTALGGETPAHDLALSIDSVIEYQEKINYPKPDYNDPRFTDNGTFTIEIERDNNDVTDDTKPAQYTIIKQDFTKTRNYDKSHNIIIRGSELGGADGVNDLTLDIDEVNVPEIVYPVDSSKIKHKIADKLITDAESTAKTSANEVKGTAKDYKLKIGSIDGKYEVTIEPDDGSEGFDVGDIIYIPGAQLTGETGNVVNTKNDLQLIVSSIGTNGKIVSLTIDPLYENKARKPSVEIIATTKLNDTHYHVELKPVAGSDLLVLGDTFVIEGNDIGGDTGTHDLSVVIKDIKDDVITIERFGTAKSQTGNIGEILKVTPKGTAFKNLNIGEIKNANVSQSGTPVLSSSLPKVSMSVKLEDDWIYSTQYVDELLKNKYIDITNAKNSLVYKGRKYILELDDYQKNKMKCMNMSLVLYDEVPEYVSSSYDGIRGNTYSRLSGCQSKRI